MSVISIKSITEVEKAEWDKIAPADFPFASYEFLNALEGSQSLGDRTGWYPLYQTARIDGQLVAALLLFLKTNSYGEYIFDFAWANAFESSGLDYYPKIVSAIPFTPATGPKLLFAKDLSEEKKSQLASELFSSAVDLATELKASSIHSLFIPKAQTPLFDQSPFTLRHSFQFHWRNNNYQSFEDFLSRLKSKRRKEVVRERSQVEKTGVSIQRLTGPDLTEEHAQIMYAFYVSTVRKMGGYAYLNLEFYKRVFATMSEKILFVLALDSSGDPIAGALNYFGANTLFGRSWGCIDDYKSLHFELCYYQGIEFAIERGFDLFEAGAQGEHKLQRGFLPALTYSAHYLQEPRFRRAIDHFIAAEKVEIAQIFSAYETHSPFAETSL